MPKEIARMARACGRAALEAAVETLWPTRCAVCDASGALLCDRCRLNMAYIDRYRACPRCGAPFGSVQCSECNPVMLAARGYGEPKRDRMWPPRTSADGASGRGGADAAGATHGPKPCQHVALPFAAAASVVAYDQAARSIVSTYKDGGERRLAQVMADLMAPCVAPAWRGDATAVVFVPSSAKAVRRRGFDHAELLARALAGNLSLPCAPVFQRPRSADQRTLARRERMANMAGRIALLPGATPPASALLIDDVFTTGATLFAASEALAQAGVAPIYCLTFARVW